MGRAEIKAIPSKESLRELLSYDPATGALEWKPRDNDAFMRRHGAGPAGTVDRSGYLAIGIRIDGKISYFKAHRLIWRMMTGDDPGARHVDHIDGVRSNNRWVNLRLASHGQNRQNAKVGRNNHSGAKGVCWAESHRAWVAYIGIGGHQIRLGRFKRLEDAVAARRDAADALHGDFHRAA